MDGGWGRGRRGQLEHGGRVEINCQAARRGAGVQSAEGSCQETRARPGPAPEEDPLLSQHAAVVREPGGAAGVSQG